MRRRLGPAMVLTAMLVLAGCGGGDAKDPAADPTAAPSPTAPPGLDTTAPTRPAQSHDAAGAAAYGAYFADLVQYAIRTRSVRPVYAEAFDQARCTTCRKLGTYIDDLKKGGYWEIGDDLQLGRFRARPTRDDFRVSGPFTYPASSYVEVDGHRASRVQARPYRFSADLTWDAKRHQWRVLDYSFVKDS